MGSEAEARPGAQSLEAVLEVVVEARRTAARTIRLALGEMPHGIVNEIVIKQWESPLGIRQIRYDPSANLLALVSLASTYPYNEELGVCAEVLTEEGRQILTPEDHPDDWIRHGARIATTLEQLRRPLPPSVSE